MRFHSLRNLFRALLCVVVLVLVPSACVKADDSVQPQVSPPGLAPCGMGDASIPDFTLIDDNANSPTSGEEISLADYSGKVLMIFWMRAT
jgi:hypothetical protein